MDLTIIEYALKPVGYVWRQVKKLYTSAVNDGFEEAFQLALADWSKHTPSSSDKLRLREASKKYLQNPTSYESLDADTQAFIVCFKKRLSEQAAAHNSLMMDRADKQAKIEEQNLREHGKTQESIQGLMSRMEGLNMAPQYIRALLKELPLEQGLEPTELALEGMLSNGRIHSEGAKCLVAEFVRFLFEHTSKITEEIKRLREAGDSYLADTLDEIKKVLTGESEQSLTTVYEEFKTREQQNEVRVLKELIEAAQIQFSFGEARSFYERLIELSPTVEHHFEYAYLLQSLNDFEKARHHYEEALQIHRELAQQNPEAYLPKVATSLNNLGVLLRDTNDLKKAQDYYEEALQIHRELAQQNPEAYLPKVATSLNNLGVLLRDTNDLKKAQDYYEEALQIHRELAQQNPEAYLPDVAASLNNLGVLLRDTNDLKKAQDYYEKALQIHRELAQQNPEAYLPKVAASLNNLGVLLHNTNDLKKAQDYQEEALQILRKLAQQNPRAYLPDVATSLNNLTTLYLGLGKKEDAEKAYLEAHDIYQKLANRHPRAYEIDYARILAMGFNLLGKPKEVLEEAKAILGKYPEHPKARKLLSAIEKLAKG